MHEHPARRLANLERELAEIGEQFRSKKHRNSHTPRLQVPSGDIGDVMSRAHTQHYWVRHKSGHLFCSICGAKKTVAG